MNVQSLTTNFIKTLADEVSNVATVALGPVKGKLALEHIVPVHGYVMNYELRLIAYQVGKEKYPPTQVISSFDFSKLLEVNNHKSYAEILANQLVSALTDLVDNAGSLHLITISRPYNAYMKRVIV